VIEKQKIVTDKDEDYDVINYARGKSKVCVQVFFVREGKLLGREAFFLEGVQGEDEVILPFLQQYYSMSPLIPPEILIPAWETQGEDTDTADFAPATDGGLAAPYSAPDERAGAFAHRENALAESGAAYIAPGAEAAPEDELTTTREWLSRLRGRKVQIRTPKRGERKGLLEMVGRNARDLLLQKEQHEENREDRFAVGIEEIKGALGLDVLPHRMECYDISHISGTETVASMAVSIDGRPKPEYYRRFKIKSVEGNDDFASMAEVILRRFSKARREDARFGELPDLVVIDGGKGQLSSARSVMELMEVGQIAALGLAKQNEWIYTPDRADPIILDHKSPGLQLLQMLRDEAHRFALTYHRLLRGKRNLASAIDEIPGLGPKGKKALLNHFQLSLKNIMTASREELAAAPGLNRKTAEAVYDWFHPRE